jgi:phospholipid/cholesterol/gamma-HCH transport system substrate-binding protein
MIKLTNEVKIALVAIAAIVMLFIGLQFLKGVKIFSTDDHYYVRFSEITGMSTASPIYANGYKVGVVERIDYDFNNPESIIATVSIDNRLALTKGTYAEIASDLLGNVKVELKLGDNPLDVLAKGDTIRGGIQEGMMGKAAAMLPQVEKMLPKIDSILSSINNLLADPALANSLHNVDHITANLTATTQELHHLSASLNQQMPQMLNTANGVLTNTEGITRKLNDIDVAATMSKVDETLANVQQMTQALNSREGTLGLLLHDPQLYHNLNATMSDADQLMIDLKAHPKRYVHFSVFGKKDK